MWHHQVMLNPLISIEILCRDKSTHNLLLFRFYQCKTDLCIESQPAAGEAREHAHALAIGAELQHRQHLGLQRGALRLHRHLRPF